MSKVFLVGAGPGDPELLTVKAHRLLRQADVILHDGLVSPEVLQLASKDAMVIDVGKRCGRACVTQEQINALMLLLASSGETIVRLKSGDPMLFGRSAEEMEALKNARVDYEVVPGVTAALAAASQLGISLTDRRSCSHVVFTTGHHCAGTGRPDWSGLLRPDSTLAIYMPGSDYGSLARALELAGFAGETPCVLISRIGFPDQRVHRSTLDRMADLPLLATPALFLAGRAVAGVCRSQSSGEEDLVPERVSDQAVMPAATKIDSR